MKTIYLLIISLLFVCFQSKAQTWQWTHPESNNDIYADNFAHDIEVDSSGNVYVLSFYRDSLFLGGSFIAKGTGSCIAKYNTAGALQWYKLITNTNAQQNAAGLIYASDMVVNAQGIYITGCYSTPSTYLCQYNCLTGETTCYQPDYAIGNINFTSHFGELGFFITKFDTSGSVNWNKLGLSTASKCDLPFISGLGGPKRPLITSDKNNNITIAFMAGVYNNGTPNSISIGGDIIPLENNPNVSQLVTVKYNAAGSLQSSAHTNGGSYPGIVDYNSIAADNNANIFLYGTATDSTYFGSQLFRTSTPPSESGFYYQSTFIAKLSSNGEWQFAKELCNYSNNYLQVGADYGNPDLLTIDNSNNVYALVNAGNTAIILGDSIGNNKYGNNFIVKMSNNGSLVWHKFFGQEVYTYSQSICYANNNLYLSGQIRDYGYPSVIFSDLYIPYYGKNGVEQHFVAKADVDGNFKWVAAFNADYRTWGLGVKVYQDNIYTCGSYYNQLQSLGNLNGAPSNTGNYKIFSGKLKDQYIRVGAITPTALIPGCTVSIPFTSYGLSFSARNKFFAELSNSNGDFTSATTIGNTTSTGTGTITAKIPATLTYGSGYRIRIRSSDTLATGYSYYVYADTGYALSLVCPPPSSGFAATNITGTSATLNWTAVGCASGYRIQYRVKGTTAWITAAILTTNVASYNLTGLTANTTYQWRIATRCKNNGGVSFSAYTTAKQFKTAASLSFADINNLKTNTTLQVLVQPNPAITNATLMLGGNIKDASISITDFIGKTLWVQHGVNASQIELPIQHFAAGIYLVKVVNGNETSIVKLVKQ